MTITLENRSQYTRKVGSTDFWEWTAYVKCDPPDSLDDIEYVEYHLHPTFHNPVRRVFSQQGGFPLRSEGWGTFELKARVVFKGSEKEPRILKHELKFDAGAPLRKPPLRREGES